MANRIRSIEVYDRSLSPVSAEVWISVLAEYTTATTEVRGRLMGPRCLYANTVEVAYSLLPLPPALGALTQPRAPELSGLAVRAVIPEASLWEPQSPFLYRGPLELWQDGQRCDRFILSHGLRSLQINRRGLCVNGQVLTPHGRRIAVCSDEEAARLRQEGYNLLIAPVAASSLVVWEQADRFGFLVLGQRSEDADETRLMERLRFHASCLGWLSAESSALNAEEAIDRHINRVRDVQQT